MGGRVHIPDPQHSPDAGAPAQAAQPDPAPAHAPSPRRSPARSPSRHRSQKPKEVCDVLDLVFILSAALLLLFVTFWLAGIVSGQSILTNLPPWLSSVFKTGKGAVGAIGTTAALQLLRHKLDRGTGPQYLVWVVALFVLLGGSAIGLSKVIKPATAVVSPMPADLFFTAPYDQATPVLFVHEYPRQKQERLVLQPREVIDPPSYLAHIVLPGDTTTQLNAHFKAVQLSSQLTQPQDAGGYYSLCLQRAASSPTGSAQIFLSCRDGDCALDSKRNGDWVEACGSHVGNAAQRDLIQPVSLQPISAWLNPPMVQASGAAQHTIHSSVPFWQVPLLQTLEQTNANKRVGYTRFDITMEPSAALAGSDHYQYRVLVNGQPIYFNGFPPEVLRESFNPGQPLHFSFGLENLSFSGADQGFENLAVELTFLKGDKATVNQTVQRKYVALRNADPTVESTAAGKVTWAGTYVAPPHENKYEVIVNSTPKVDDAMQLKARLDRLNLRVDDRPAVLVVRPPLRTPPYYGVTVGIVQPSGQVQFTFDEEQAARVCSWALDQRQTTHIVHSDVFRYEVATRAYIPCGKLN